MLSQVFFTLAIGYIGYSLWPFTQQMFDHPDLIGQIVSMQMIKVQYFAQDTINWLHSLHLDDIVHSARSTILVIIDMAVHGPGVYTVWIKTIRSALEGVAPSETVQIVLFILHLSMFSFIYYMCLRLLGIIQVIGKILWALTYPIRWLGRPRGRARPRLNMATLRDQQRARLRLHGPEDEDRGPVNEDGDTAGEGELRLNNMANARARLQALRRVTQN